MGMMSQMLQAVVSMQTPRRSLACIMLQLSDTYIGMPMLLRALMGLSNTHAFWSEAHLQRSADVCCLLLAKQLDACGQPRGNVQQNVSAAFPMSGAQPRVCLSIEQP